MVEIIPAILPKSFADLEGKLALIREVAPWVQVDVVDGVFAKNKTWPYTDPEQFEKLAHEEEPLPFWEDIQFEFDAMVAHPKEEIEKFLHAGALRIVVHGAGGEILDVLKSLAPQRQGEFAIEIGVALLPGDTAGVFAPYKDFADFVQVMGIADVGFQGSAFDERALACIASLRESFPELTIQVDGGIKFEHCKPLVRAGANRLVVGSAIFAAREPQHAYAELVREANSL